MHFLSNKELEQHIKSLYDKTKSVVEIEDFTPLDVNFKENHVNDSIGYFCFSDEHGYHFREIERGIVKRDVLTQCLFKISFLTVENAVFWCSVDYEAKHRIPNQDHRRLLFSKWLEIHSAIGQEYATKVENEIQEILVKVPFQDELFKS